MPTAAVWACGTPLFVRDNLEWRRPSGYPLSSWLGKVVQSCFELFTMGWVAAWGTSPEGPPCLEVPASICSQLMIRQVIVNVWQENVWVTTYLHETKKGIHLFMKGTTVVPELQIIATPIHQFFSKIFHRFIYFLFHLLNLNFPVFGLTLKRDSLNTLIPSLTIIFIPVLADIHAVQWCYLSSNSWP